jgi:hypothetical protein
MFSATTVAAGSVLFIAAGFGLYFYPTALYYWKRRRRSKRSRKGTASPAK